MVETSNGLLWFHPTDIGRLSHGIDAPICQDGRSGGFTELLARAEVSHDALIDFPSEKAFKASDDVPFRPSIRPASDDIVDRRLVIAHTDHDGSMEGGVREPPRVLERAR